MEATILTRDLVKTFGPTRALDGLELEVAPGEVHGFLGPNGAGKSTTIRILLGLLRKDAGHVEVLGRRPWEDAVELHRNVAYVPGDVHLWPNLSGGEAIDLLGDLRGGIDKGRRDELVERFKLDPTKRCSTYSKGNRQKVGLIAAFSSFVDLYLLDEPTAGLDPLMDSVFQSVVTEVQDRGSTVLLSSHILAEAEKLCDRISIIREGRIVESGTLAQLRHLTRTSVSVETEREPAGLEQLEGVHDVVVDGTHARFEVEPGAVQTTMSHLAGFGIQSITATPPTLEELFMRHYGDEVPAAENAEVTP